jgi:hypothetical protein
MLEMFLSAKRKVITILQKWGLYPTKSADTYYAQTVTVDKTKAFTIEGWFRVLTQGTNYVFSLSGYYNAGSTLYHHGIAFSNGNLIRIMSYKFNSFTVLSSAVVQSAAYTLNQWVHVAVEVEPQPDGKFIIKIAKNGVFIYTATLNPILFDTMPMCGGPIGLGDPNGSIMPGSGEVLDTSVALGLTYKGVNFTPPARSV